MSSNLSNLKTRQPLLFTLPQAADICGLKLGTLRIWISVGVITPAKKGMKGYNHWFTAQQLLGLAIIAGLHGSPTGCSTTHAKAMMQQWGSMTETQLDHWLSTWKPTLASDHTEEAFVSFGSSPVFTGVKRPKPEGWDVTRADIMQRLERVDAAILERLEESSLDRLKQARAEASKGTK